MANIPPPSPALGGGHPPPATPQYVSVPPPSDYSYQEAPAIPLVPPPPPPYPPTSVEAPPPPPPPTAPHFDDEEDAYGPSAPPPPAETPVVRPPADTKVDVDGDSKQQVNAPIAIPSSSSAGKAKFSMDQLPAYLGFFTLGILLGLAFNLFSFTFNCCMPSLKNKNIRRNFFNAGCAVGSIAQIGLLVLIGITIKNAISRAFDKIQSRPRK